MANDERAGGMASDVVKVTGTPPERSVNRRILALAIPTIGRLDDSAYRGRAVRLSGLWHHIPRGETDGCG